MIQPSNSPWTSPVVLVWKKDGSHRFCVDYHGLNAVTSATYRIDVLLDQLGKSKYFSTLDLASGFWQIRMHPESQKKTVFVTPQALFKFRVIPFGLTNAPAVFQHLMQWVVSPLNPTPGPDFVSVYMDDILVFSQTLEDHLEHLQKVFVRLCEVGLKLKPTKCNFVHTEFEYLGHLITPGGLKTNPRLTSAVRGFPIPQNAQDVRCFLGLTLYYRRFVHKFTRKEASFEWTPKCHSVFDDLKEKLTTSPVPPYTRLFPFFSPTLSHPLSHSLPLPLPTPGEDGYEAHHGYGTLHITTAYAAREVVS